MSRLSDYKEEYRQTWEAYKEAKKDNDKEAMKSLSHDLVKLADLMESEM